MSNTPRTDNLHQRYHSRYTDGHYTCYVSDVFDFARQLERELAEITEQLDEVVDENHLLKFQLKTEKHLNEDHEKDYLAIWKLIKKPNETVVDAAKRIKLNLAEVTKQRDDLLESLKEVMPYIVGDRCVPWEKAQDAINRATEGGAR